MVGIEDMKEDYFQLLKQHHENLDGNKNELDLITKAQPNATISGLSSVNQIRSEGYKVNFYLLVTNYI